MQRNSTIHVIYYAAMESLNGPAHLLKSAADFERVLKEKKDHLAAIRDSIGNPIEHGIIDVVAVLQLQGINTIASCEGHTDRAEPFPWIDVEAPGEPAFRWTDEDRLSRELLSELGIDRERIMAGPEFDEAAYDQYDLLVMKRLGENPTETNEYKIWVRTNTTLTRRLLELSGSFNVSDVPAEESAKPRIAIIPLGGTGGARVAAIDRQVPRDQQLIRRYRRRQTVESQTVRSQGVARRVWQRRLKMHQFGKFILEQMNT